MRTALPVWPKSNWACTCWNLGRGLLLEAIDADSASDVDAVSDWDTKRETFLYGFFFNLIVREPDRFSTDRFLSSLQYDVPHKAYDRHG